MDGPFEGYRYNQMPKKRGIVRERILRVLLNNPGGDHTRYRVAKSIGSTYSWVHDCLRDLENKGLVEQTRVVNFRDLVLFWMDLRVVPERREYMIRKPPDLLKSAGMEYALTTYAAENLVQQYLFPSRTDFHIHSKDQARWHRILSQVGLVGGGNTRVLIGDAHVFYNSSEYNGLKTVSIPQLAVDLLIEGGPCIEAAEMLMEKERHVHGR